MRLPKTTTELADGIIRVVESDKNAYDFHVESNYLYYKDGRLYALFHVGGGYDGSLISTLRPPYAGAFSNGKRSAYFESVEQAEAFMLSEIRTGLLQPYREEFKPLYNK